MLSWRANWPKQTCPSSQRTRNAFSLVPLYIHQALGLPGALNAALLIFSFVACCAAGRELTLLLDPRSPRRLALLVGSVAWAAALVVITEMLSPLHLLSAGPSALALAVVTVATAAAWRYWRTQLDAPSTPPASPTARPPAPLAVLMIAAAAAQAAWIALTAYTYAPNNYDALTYHLPRVLHWVQAASSGPYATNTERQVQYPPGAEYIVTQLHFVLSDDTLANFVQWAGMLLAAVAVTEIARRLGAGGLAQLGAALLALALPIGIGEAATTQNDFVEAGWLAAFAALGLGFAANPTSRIWGILTGLALGLAVLTKSTAYIYVPPLILLVGAVALRRSAAWTALLPAILLGVVAYVSLNLGQYLRVYRTYHSLLGPTGCCNNEVHTPASLASSIIRNLALQVPMGGPLEPLGRALQGGLAELNSLTGFDPLDPRLTTTGAIDVFQQTFWYGPDFAGNLVQTILILATLGWLLWSRSDRLAKLYALALVGCFLLFSGYLKFQIWGNRLELPLLVLWAPAIAAVLLDRMRLGAGLVPLAVLVLSFNWTAHSQDAAPGYGSNATRTEYYAGQSVHPQFPAYQDFATAILAGGCRQVGLSFASDNVPEYPLWAMLQERGFTGRIEHVDVQNSTRRWADPDFQPCAVIADEPRAGYPAPAWQTSESHGMVLYLRK